MSSIGIDDNLFDATGDDTVDWNLIWDPSRWYITPELIVRERDTFLMFNGVSLLCAIVYLCVYWYGRSWWSQMKRSRINISDWLINLLWCLCYIPLGLSAWLIFLESNQKWNRALTVFSLHLVVNVIFPFSIWVIRDFSLALLNLLILIGVGMFTTSQFNTILPFCSSCNTPYLLFLFFYFVQFCIIWYLNEGKNMMKEAMKEGLVTTSFSSSTVKVKQKDKKKKRESFPGSKKMKKLLQKRKQMLGDDEVEGEGEKEGEKEGEGEEDNKKMQ